MGSFFWVGPSSNGTVVFADVLIKIATLNRSMILFQIHELFIYGYSVSSDALSWSREATTYIYSQSSSQVFFHILYFFFLQNYGLSTC